MLFNRPDAFLDVAVSKVYNKGRNELMRVITAAGDMPMLLMLLLSPCPGPEHWSSAHWCSVFITGLHFKSPYKSAVMKRK